VIGAAKGYRERHYLAVHFVNADGPRATRNGGLSKGFRRRMKPAYAAAAETDKGRAPKEKGARGVIHCRSSLRHHLPAQRGNVSLTNLQVLNAILYVAEQGCKWRGLPKRFGRWHTIYMRMNPPGRSVRAEFAAADLYYCF